jgi:hypothetical protein
MTHLHPNHPQKTPEPDTKAIFHSVFVDGAEHVVSYGGTSQYNRDGTGASACGLAALNLRENSLLYGTRRSTKRSSSTGRVGSRVRRGMTTL